MQDSPLIHIDLPKIPRKPLPNPNNHPFLPSFAIPFHRPYKVRDPIPLMKRYKTELKDN